MKLKYEIRDKKIPNLYHFVPFYPFVYDVQMSYEDGIDKKTGEPKFVTVYGKMRKYDDSGMTGYPLLGDKENPYFVVDRKKIHIKDFRIPYTTPNVDPLELLLKRLPNGMQDKEYSDEDILRMMLLKYWKQLAFQFVKGYPKEGTYYLQQFSLYNAVHDRVLVLNNYHFDNCILYTDDLIDLMKRGIVIVRKQ